MSDKKLVSMIMPCFNSAPYLDKMLQSIYDQTYDNIEVIIAYDDSTDGTLTILKNWKVKFDKRGYKYNIVRNPSRAGIIGGINSALPYFTGDYVTFPDSDDYLFPGYVEEMSKALTENPEYGWVRCDSIRVRDRDIAFDGNNVADFNFETEYSEIYESSFDERYKELGSVMNFILYTIPRAPWRLMARREYLFKAIPEGVFYAHPSSHELPIDLALANLGEFYPVNKALYKYTIHEDGYYNSRMQNLHKVIPYFDSMQQLATDCINNLDTDEETRNKYHLANSVYYYSIKAYYSRLHGSVELSKKYGRWMASAMKGFTGYDIIPEGYDCDLYWKHIYRIAPKVAAQIKLDENKEYFSKELWDKENTMKVILLGSEDDCAGTISIMKDLGMKEPAVAQSIDELPDDKDICVVSQTTNTGAEKSTLSALSELGYAAVLSNRDNDLALRYGMLKKYFTKLV